MEQEATLYRQISRQLLQDIYKGTYPYGTKLPSLQALCEQFGVGRNTIRAALALLEKDGALQREKGELCPGKSGYTSSREESVFSVSHGLFTGWSCSCV